MAVIYVTSSDRLRACVSPQPYWHLINSSVVSFLTSRGSCLTKLDLSWCGNYGALSDTDFCKYGFQGSTTSFVCDPLSVTGR